jgi:uncharacterized protein YuzE
MKEPYLEVTFRHGRPIAAYLYLPRPAGEKSHRTKRLEPGLIIDFDRDGKPIGIEITAPGQISVASLNQALRDLGLSEISSDDLAPLCAA